MKVSNSLWDISLNTVECCYKAVQCNMVFHTPLHWLAQNIYQPFNSHETLAGELWSVNCEDFEDLGDNWSRYNGTALYVYRGTEELFSPQYPPSSRQSTWLMADVMDTESESVPVTQSATSLILLWWKFPAVDFDLDLSVSMASLMLWITQRKEKNASFLYCNVIIV